MKKRIAVLSLVAMFVAAATLSAQTKPAEKKVTKAKATVTSTCCKGKSAEEKAKCMKDSTAKCPKKCCAKAKK